MVLQVTGQVVVVQVVVTITGGGVSVSVSPGGVEAGDGTVGVSVS